MPQTAPRRRNRLRWLAFCTQGPHNRDVSLQLKSLLVAVCKRPDTTPASIFQQPARVKDRPGRLTWRPPGTLSMAVEHVRFRTGRGMSVSHHFIGYDGHGRGKHQDQKTHGEPNSRQGRDHGEYGDSAAREQQPSVKRTKTPNQVAVERVK